MNKLLIPIKMFARFIVRLLIVILLVVSVPAWVVGIFFDLLSIIVGFFLFGVWWIITGNDIFGLLGYIPLFRNEEPYAAQFVDWLVDKLATFVNKK